MKIKTKDLAVISMYAALYAALGYCFRRHILWANSSSRRRCDGVGCPVAWSAWSVGPHSWSIHRKHFFSRRLSRPPKHHPFLCHVFCSLLHLQKNKKRLHSNWNMPCILLSFRHDSRMDALVPVRAAPASYNCI